MLVMNAPIKLGAADFQAENIPGELKAEKAFIPWRASNRTNARGEVLVTKVPLHHRTGKPASVTDPESCVDFGEALRASERLHADGIGFVFTTRSPYVGIDLDNCLGADGVLDGQVAEMIADIPGYWEVSPSGRGIKGIVYAPGLRLDGLKAKNFPRTGLDVEVYTQDRYFTLTGHEHALSSGQTPLPDSGEAVRRLCERLTLRLRGAKSKAVPTPAAPVAPSDLELLERARRAQNGQEFAALYDRAEFGQSQSEADLSLCNKLAFWLGADPGRMDAAFRASALMRDKWDRSVGRGETYGQRCIRKAIEATVETYTAPRERSVGARTNGESNGAHHAPQIANGTFESHLSRDSDDFQWPEILPLDAWETPEPPSGCLPESLELVTNAVSDCNQTPRDNPQAIAICVISTATHGQYYVKIGQRLENLAVAAGVGADSAERKSADIYHLAAPLYAHEAEAREVYRDELAEQEAERQLLESRRAALLKKASKGEGDLRGELAELIRRLNALAALRPKRLTCQDVTPEKLSSLLAEQGSIGLLSAEGGPFEGMAGKYARRDEVATVYMSAFSGEMVAKDTLSGGSYFSEKPSLAMLIMSQPSHLRGVLSNPLFSGRGLLERFFWVFAQPRAGYRDVRNAKPIAESISLAYRDTIRRLLPPTTPVNGQPPERQALTISDTGLETLTELAAWLEPQYRPDGDLYHVRAWANRLPTLAAKVATLWHLWDCADRRIVVAGIVPTEWVSRSVRWVREYVLPMGLKAWGLMGSDPATDYAKQILAVLEASEGAVTTRDILRAKRNLCAEKVDAGAKLLESRGYVRRLKPHTRGRGRPSESLQLSPKVKLATPGTTGTERTKIGSPPSGTFSVNFVPVVPESESLTFLSARPPQAEGEIALEDLFGDEWSVPL